MVGGSYKKPGLPPGTLIPPPGALRPETIQVIHYTEDVLDEFETRSPEEAARFKGHGGVTWVNMVGLGDADLVAGIGERFGLHPLALEDVLTVGQRPKVDDYQDHVFAVVRMLHHEVELAVEQVSVFLGSDFVITFQERPGDCLEPVRERLRKGVGQLRTQGAGYLMYAILDAIVDGYFPFLEQVGETIEDLEDDVIAKPTQHTLRRVHEVKRELLDVRRSVWPLQDAINSLVRQESPLLGDAARLYLRDCYDHAVRVLDVVETYRELASALMDAYFSSLSNRMNEVMKVLTVIATVFIPLTFIVGVYGMNFVWMPELKWRWAYPVVWAIMIALAVIMLLLFRRKGWLGSAENR